MYDLSTRVRYLAEWYARAIFMDCNTYDYGKPGKVTFVLINGKNISSVIAFREIAKSMYRGFL